MRALRRRTATPGRAPGATLTVLYHPPSMRRAGPILILIIGVLALIVDFVPGLSVPDSSDSGSRVLETKLGLDLQGGLRVEYQAQPVNGKAPDAAALGVIRTII